MTESTARADRYDPQTSASPFYTWEVPQKPVSVRIPHNLIDRLEKEAVDNFRSLSSRGSEIGGLLIGSVSPGNPAIVSLSDYELVSCEYSRGPLYRLSEADVARFERAIQQCLAGGMGLAGFFRSQARKKMSLDAEDLAFFDQHFRDVHQIALLVRPYATKASMAGIFIREGGKIDGESSLLEFPFRSSELGPTKPAPDLAENFSKQAPAPAAQKPAGRAQIVPIASRREPTAVPEPAAAAAFAPEPSAVPASAPPAKPVTPAAAAPPPATAKTAAVPAPTAPPAEERSSGSDGQLKDSPSAKDEKTAVADKPAAAATTAVEPEPAPRSNKAVKLALAAAASITLFVILFVYPGLMRSSGKPTMPALQDTSGLQLRVERTAGELLLTWNRDSDAIRTATKAMLSIADGDQREDVELDLAQLRNGSIVYSPSGTDISFKMVVTGRGQNKVASESVRVLRTRPSPVQDQPQPAAQNDQPAPKPANSAVSGTNGPTQAAASQDKPAQEETKPAARASALRPFKAESLAQRLRPVATAALPEAPIMAGLGATPAAIPGMNLNAGVSAPAAPPPPLVPAAPVNTQPITTRPVTPPVKTGGQIQQATLIFKKDPEYPKIAKQTGAKGQVKLVATIGKDGKVKGVKVVSGHPILQNAAMDAVKQWIYKPTMLNGSPVETETEILVNFLGER